jgi:hypothetical protein
MRPINEGVAVEKEEFFCWLVWHGAKVGNTEVSALRYLHLLYTPYIFTTHNDPVEV